MNKEYQISKSMTLSQAYNPKYNSFDFIRFFCALLLLFSHSFTLGGFGVELLFGNPQETYGGFAVAVFFVIGGFLITQSVMRSRSIVSFLWNRFLRIFPGFWVCLLVNAFIFTPLICIIENKNMDEYVRIIFPASIEYIKANFLGEMKQYGIADILKGNPFPGALNGSLWILIYELKFYIFAGIMATLAIFKKYKFIIPILFLLFWLSSIADRLQPGYSAMIFPYFKDIWIPRLFVYFTIGSSFYLYAERIDFDYRLFLIALVILVFSIKDGFYPLAAPICITYVVLYLACKLPFQEFGRYGDFSYGLFLYGFQIQQILAALGANQLGFLTYVFMSISITLPIAVLSYYLVEKPCLKLKGFTSR